MGSSSSSGWSLRCLLYGIIGQGVAQSPQSKILRIDNSNIYSSSNMGGIQYSDGWIHNVAVADHYSNTVSVTQVANASAVFFFRGSSIVYYAGKPRQPTSGYATVDGISEPIIPNTAGSGNPTWPKSGLDGGDHMLVISRNNDTIPWDFSLDYLEVTYENDARASLLSPGAINAPPSLINLVDDTDERIIYRGAWKKWGAPRRGFFFGGRISATTEPGSSMSSFNGTSIWHFSDKHWRNAKVLISVDGGEGEVVSTALAYNDDERWFTQVLCWSKTDLTNGLHTINIAHDDEEGKWFGVDFLAYASIPRAASKPKVSLGGAVGGAVGGGVGAILTCLLTYWLYRRRMASREAHPEASGAETSINHESAKSPSPDQTMASLTYRSEQWSPVTMVAYPNSNKAPTDGTGQWSTQQYPRLPYAA